MVGPAAKREAVAHLRNGFALSERRACSIDRSDLLVGELGKFLGACPLREVPAVLPQESHHQVECRIRKIKECFDAALRLIVALQVRDLTRQCVVDGFHDAVGEEFRLSGRVEKAVEIARFVEHADIERGRCLPFGERQAGARGVFEHFAVPFDVLKEHGGDREGDPRRIEPAACQHVMDKPAFPERYRT